MTGGEVCHTQGCEDEGPHIHVHSTSHRCSTTEDMHFDSPKHVHGARRGSKIILYPVGRDHCCCPLLSTSCAGSPTKHEERGALEGEESCTQSCGSNEGGKRGEGEGGKRCGHRRKRPDCCQRGRPGVPVVPTPSSLLPLNIPGVTYADEDRKHILLPCRDNRCTDPYHCSTTMRLKILHNIARGHWTILELEKPTKKPMKKRARAGTTNLVSAMTEPLPDSSSPSSSSYSKDGRKITSDFVAGDEGSGGGGRRREERESETKIYCSGICCASEIPIIEKLLLPEEGVLSVHTNAMTRMVTVRHLTDVTPSPTLLILLRNGGMGPRLKTSTVIAEEGDTQSSKAILALALRQQAERENRRDGGGGDVEEEEQGTPPQLLSVACAK